MQDQAALYGIDSTTAKERADELIEAFELGSFQNKTVRELSGGQRRRLEVAMGMVHKPKLIFLDEPTVGLDVGAARDIRAYMQEWMRATPGRTILLTTHYMHEAEELCDRVAIMDKGKVIALGTVDELVRAHGGQVSVTIRRAGQVHRIQTQDPTAELAKALDRPIHLFLHVKVSERWAEDPSHYRTIGLDFEPKK